jgi:hypothetical protein
MRTHAHASINGHMHTLTYTHACTQHTLTVLVFNVDDRPCGLLLSHHPQKVPIPLEILEHDAPCAQRAIRAVSDRDSEDEYDARRARAGGHLIAWLSREQRVHAT